MPKNIFARLAQAVQNNKAQPEKVQPPAEAGSAGAEIFEIGRIIGQKYRLDDEIGRGGMGIVYRAHDIPNDRDVAIKIISLGQANALTLEQFSREASITASLSHPNIVQVYETGAVEQGGKPQVRFIVMELVRGTGLDNLHNLSYASIIDIGKQICDALGYAHAQGFVHRDLKPANVLIEKRGFQYFAKLVDFGLARQRGVENQANESNTAGTVFYLAPEVIAGQLADVSSDLYALGAMLYELVTGRVPFSDFFDDQSILSQHLTETVAPPSHSRADVPSRLEAIILRLLAKKPADRYAAASEVGEALQLAKPEEQTGEKLGNLPILPPVDDRKAAEILQIQGMLASSRLVTLLVADEALLLQAGTALTAMFSDGVWFVSLERVEEPAGVLKMIANSLGLKRNPERPLAVSLVEFLREKNLLLLLGLCGRFPAASAQFAETVISSCPDVYVLASSHTPLNIPAEQCYTSSSSS